MSGTVTAQLERAARYLAEHGVESARLEAEVLLADVLGWDRARLLTERGHEIDDGEKVRLDELLVRRGRREPLQHLRGRQEFFSREFVVDSRVLIPRSETEVLVETALAIARAIERPAILDVGTGSGAIAITLALELPGAAISATDSSLEAIDVARSNARRLGADVRVEFRRGDLCAPFAERRFDLVVSNPPYVASREIPVLAPEVRDHEPRLALDGGADGLEYYRRLAASASRVMIPGGALLVEIGFGQRESVTSVFAASGFVVANVTRDLSGIERVLTVRRG